MNMTSKIVQTHVTRPVEVKKRFTHLELIETSIYSKRITAVVSLTLIRVFVGQSIPENVSYLDKYEKLKKKTDSIKSSGRSYPYSAYWKTVVVDMTEYL